MVEWINKIWYVHSVESETAMKRTLSRIVCSNCGTSYNLIVEALKPKNENICDKCNNDLKVRTDDNEETFINRFDTYIDKTQSLIDYYEDKADFKHYVNIYMGTHTGCISGRLQSIKDSLKVIAEAELTKTQQVAMKLSKELLDVFYAHRENFEKVIDAYAERAGRTYDENLEYYRELTDYYARMEEITAYWSLIAEVPEWTF